MKGIISDFWRWTAVPSRSPPAPDFSPGIECFWFRCCTWYDRFACDISTGLHLKLTEFISLHTTEPPSPPSTASLSFFSGGREEKKYKGNLFLCHSRQPQKATEENVPTSPHPPPLAHTGLSFLCAFVCILCSGPRPPPSVPAPTPPIPPTSRRFFFCCQLSWKVRVESWPEKCRSVYFYAFQYTPQTNPPPTHTHNDPMEKRPFFSARLWPRYNHSAALLLLCGKSLIEQRRKAK